MAQQNNAKTVRERVDSRRGLQATVRPATTYDNARGGYVERPFGAGRDMQALAGALSQFDRSLGGFLDQKLDKQIEEGAAKGQVTFAENPSENKNMQDWKAFTEANPQYTNENPWVKKGYEQARLQALGLDYEAGVSNALVGSGLNNERDLNKVTQFIDDYEKSFREKTGLDQYEDKITLAKTYSGVTARVKQNLVKNHIATIESQNEALLGQQHMDKGIKTALNTFDVAVNGRTRILNDPKNGDANASLIASIFINEVEQATSKGLRNAKAPELAAQMVFTLYDKTRNPAVLNALDKIVINGVAVSNLPNIAARKQQYIEAATARARDATRWAWAQENQNFDRAKRNVIPTVFDAIERKETVTLEYLQDKGVPRELWGTYIQSYNEMKSGLNKSMTLSPTGMQSYNEALIQAKTGILSPGGLQLYCEIFGPEEVKGLVTAYSSAQDGADKDVSSMAAGLGTFLYSQLSKQPSGGNNPLTAFARLTSEQENVLGQYQRDGNEAYIMGATQFLSEVETLKAKNGGRPPSQEQLLLLKMRVQDETLKNMQTKISERATQQDAATARQEAERRAARGTRGKKGGEGATITPKARKEQDAQRTVEATVNEVISKYPVLETYRQDMLMNPGKIQQYVQTLQGAR